MNAVFDWCVDSLVSRAPLLGMSYKELNVGLFVIVMPGRILILGRLCLNIFGKLR